jgi:hypothetical protein
MEKSLVLCCARVIVGIKYEDSHTGWPEQKVRPCVQNNESKKTWREAVEECLHALQTQRFEFNPQCSPPTPKKTTT